MISAFPEIETERLRLRQFTPEDFEPFAALRTDPEVMRYIRPGVALTSEQAREWLEKNERRWRENNFGIWVVVWRGAGELLGWCGLGRLEDTGEVEVGYGLGRNAWGRGVATEAARASLRFGFEEHKLERIAAIAIPENTASRRVMERLGMSYVRPAHHYGLDVAYYHVTRDEFRHGDAPYVLHKSPQHRDG